MRIPVSICVFVICSVVLAARESQAKKGCNAYGHACYGGHGKRSLSPLQTGYMDNNLIRNEQPPTSLHSEAVYQVYPNEANVLAENEVDAYPKYRLIKLIKSLLGMTNRRNSARPPYKDNSNSEEGIAPYMSHFDLNGVE